MNRLRTLWNAIRGYAAHDDPLVAAGNLIALVVASNQPFYPLYVYWSVGPDIGPTFYTFLSTPLFLAVPAVSRVSTLAGRVLLPLAGIANTILSAKAFGVQSGVEIFLMPCILLAFVLLRPRERMASFGAAGIGILAFLGLHDRYGAPFHLYSGEEYASFVTLNALSAATLVAFIGLLISTLMAANDPKD